VFVNDRVSVDFENDLPKFEYHIYEQTAFDKVPVLEGVIGGLAYFGVVSLMRADGLLNREGLPTCDAEEAYDRKGRMERIRVGRVDANTLIISFADAFRWVNDDALANYLDHRRRVLLSIGGSNPVGVQVKTPTKKLRPPEGLSITGGEPIKSPPVKHEKSESPVTTAELVLQIATMQADFDLRFRVMAERLAALEAAVAGK
jgi:hypothetical protein